MFEDRNNKVGWFLAGLGLGIGAAILYAPKSGRETRKAIVTGTDDSRDYVAGLARTAQEHIRNWVESGRDLRNHKGDPGKPAVEEKHEGAGDAAVAEAQHS